LVGSGSASTKALTLAELQRVDLQVCNADRASITQLIEITCRKTGTLAAYQGTIETKGGAMGFSTCECGGALIRGHWARIGEPIPNTQEVLRRVWAVYLDGVYMGTKVHIDSGSVDNPIIARRYKNPDEVYYHHRYSCAMFVPIDFIPAEAPVQAPPKDPPPFVPPTLPTIPMPRPTTPSMPN
jgi:hypothetical protein